MADTSDLSTRAIVERSAGRASSSAASVDYWPQVRPKSRQHEQARRTTAAALQEQVAQCRRLPQLTLRAPTAPDAGGSTPADSTGTAQGQAPAPRLTFVLPWLVLTDTKLGLHEVEFLASELRLRSLLQLDLKRISQRRAGMWCGQYSDGEELDRGSLVTAACALHRLVHRAGGLQGGRRRRVDGESCVVVCHEGVTPQLAANCLAAYLHWFGGLPLEAALAAGGTAAGVAAEAGELRAALAALHDSARERPSKIELRWRYQGSAVAVAGDAIGDWNRSLPMRYYPRQRCWRMQLWGLPPGRYHYKFIMDGNWVVDLGAPTELDELGNINNVVVQSKGALPRGGSSAIDNACESGEAPYWARLEAARIAFDMKMRMA